MLTLEKKFDLVIENRPVTKVIQDRVDYGQIQKMIQSQLTLMEKDIKFAMTITDKVKSLQTKQQTEQGQIRKEHMKISKNIKD